jgi:transposase
VLDEDTRRAIFTLSERGHRLRAIATSLKVSRNTVKSVLRSGAKQVPSRDRPRSLDAHRDTIAALYLECRGNLVRVHEELAARHQVTVPYATLTAFCRRVGIGLTEKKPSGEYTFHPGQEMQHDTSPHHVRIGDVMREVQCASVVFCYSRRIFARVYLRFRRFECKAFLSEAVQHVGGAALQCMIDNTHVVVLEGTGADMIPVPEMAAFADRLGFRFAAHERGHANRSARVERPFDYIENNFYPGRTFRDLDDLNAQLAAWCERDFARFRRKLGAAPKDLWTLEAPALQPLPLHIPDVYLLHQRQVCESGFVHLDTNRYSAPWKALGRRLDVREYTGRVVLQDGLDVLATHPRLEPGAHLRSQLPEHKRPVSERALRLLPTTSEIRLREAGAIYVQMVELIRKKQPGRAVRVLQQLDALRKDYPEAPLTAALTEALHYGLYDMQKLERMVIRRVAGDFFNLDIEPEPPEGQ